MKNFRSILLTGAGSGLGAALARRYAAPGVRLALIGRDESRLAQIAAECVGRGAMVEHASIDVTDQPALAAWIAASDEAQPFDLVIANAGVSGGTSGLGESDDQSRRIFAINLDGVLNTIDPILPRMRRRGAGTVALMSSLASFRGLPGAPAYGASKAAVRVLGEALRGDYMPSGVLVSVICPGFVVTPMTARNRFHMPFLMTAERAAEIMVRGLARGRARIAFPWPMYALARLIAALPAPLIDLVAARLPRKGA
ncbi:MAG TPA: SDR family NAD(P)-dependent oxidoreductase [Aliidongia sp.]|uniref:SDR family NAD(P)-dependent oxidoreductase n=1 Tax=Aliidongia sp. TaxID=1914230 RepID=UPI002DDDB8F3|nr:SDR family NAD(P)-dependent oxidoreductase [Aliidongia sp.]HEV2678634.1 SDR family NAD(P)-dependent oxidoreductase [Aliidongia sp.]